ncbi:MAG TPA: orotate phosphoribosyltransferase [Gemmatimonadales bacterium]|nr:orotate phosphoribosyltransferase [Gemmatimonadales bacterium]
MTDDESLRRLLLERSVQRGSFVLASGRRSPFYIDCRPAAMSAQGMVLIGRMAWDAIRRVGWKPSAVGGLTMGADPVSYAIAAASFGSDAPVDAFSVRKEAKDHGTGRVIEGNFKPGDGVVIVEDVITSGDSARRAAEAVERAGGKVLGIVAVVDREEGGKDALEAIGRKVLALTTVTALGLSDRG